MDCKNTGRRISKIIIFILTLIFLLTGCSNGNVNGNYYTQDDIADIQLYLMAMNNCIEKYKNVDMLVDSCDRLYSNGRTVYDVFDYDIAMKDLASHRESYEKLKDFILYYEEDFDMIIEIAKTDNVEVLEELENLKKIDDIVSSMEKEYLNALDQIENYVKTDDIKYIDKYMTHYTNIAILSSDAYDMAQNGRILFYNKIIDY